MINNKLNSKDIQQFLKRFVDLKYRFLFVSSLPSLQLKYFIISVRQTSKEIRNVSPDEHENQKSTIDCSHSDKTKRRTKNNKMFFSSH